MRVHIALVADFVTKGGAMDIEAASRATTVYLPETTIRMLPDPISCRAASLIAGEDRPVLTTDVRLSADGELIDASIYPARIPIMRRLDYDQVDRILESGTGADDTAATVARLNAAAIQLRQRRRTAGAVLVQRREAKVRVHGDDVEITVLDNASPGRTLVAEFMVLSNFVAARYAATNRIPIIYRVQPQMGGDLASMRPRLSLHPEYHAGIGLDFYAQLSSPIRRYADLVLQRQLLGALANRDHDTAIYTVDELLTVLAGAENAEASGRELERRAKRYWILRYLERHARRRPNPRLRHARRPKRGTRRFRGARDSAWRADAAESNADNGAGEPRRSAARMARIRFRRPRRRSLDRRNQNGLIGFRKFPNLERSRAIVCLPAPVPLPTMGRESAAFVHRRSIVPCRLRVHRDSGAEQISCCVASSA